ncbi:hypothetical protein BY996DRAFT_8289239 [Phakopsora pachyrhizi]|nr:hypothetical protein BY996DRAFT_8289239 [Phakopsora pachyrhizi]
MLNNQHPQHLASQLAVPELWVVVALAVWAEWEVLEGSVDSSKTMMPRISKLHRRVTSYRPFLTPKFHGMTIFHFPCILSESCF